MNELLLQPHPVFYHFERRLTAHEWKDKATMIEALNTFPSAFHTIRCSRRRFIVFVYFLSAEEVSRSLAYQAPAEASDKKTGRL